jgi:hypothetical protein
MRCSAVKDYRRLNTDNTAPRHNNIPNGMTHNGHNNAWIGKITCAAVNLYYYNT